MKVRTVKRIQSWYGRQTRPRLVAYGLAGLVFIVGLTSVLQAVQAWLPEAARIVRPTPEPNVSTYEVLDIKKANFRYLVPGKDDAWKYDETSPAFDKTTGIVKYAVKLNYTQINVTFSQQKMPEALGDKDSSKFMGFINNANPARSQNAGRGTVYFMAALQNGAPANGADTIIFATDDILMFGRAGRVVGYDAWVNLLSSMNPR